MKKCVPLTLIALGLGAVAGAFAHKFLTENNTKCVCSCHKKKDVEEDVEIKEEDIIPETEVLPDVNLEEADETFSEEETKTTVETTEDETKE